MKIGIAGAGIGGLAAAAALAQAGHEVTVYDQFDAPRPVGSGLVIQPVGQDVLAQIGAREAALKMGQPIVHMLGYAQGLKRPILDVRYDPRDTGQRFGLALHRAALFEAVHDAATQAGATITPSHPVTGRGHDQTLRFEKDRESPRFDLIVDAAGSRSPLSPLKARALPYGAIWGTVNWPDDAPLPPTQLSQRYVAARRMVGVLPIGYLPGATQRKAALFWSLTRDELTAWQSAPISDWIAQAKAIWPDMAPFLHQITDHTQMTAAFYSHGTLRTPISPGLAHIGDAAHRASPQLGQGANMALLDAWALTRAIDTSPDVDTALHRYARARRSHIRLYQAMSAVFTPLYQSNSRLLPLLRDHLLAPAAQIPPSPWILSRLVCGDLLPPLKAGLAADKAVS